MPESEPRPEPPRGAAERAARLRRRWIEPLFLLILGIQILMALAWALAQTGLWIDVSFPEGAVVARAGDVARGEIPYHDWRQWPHHFAPYGPLTYYGVGWAARLMSGRPSARFIYILGRVQSIGALIGIGLLLASLARRLDLSAPWSAVAVGAWVLWSWLIGYAGSYRPDAPQTFFSLLGLWIAMGGRARPARIAAALAAVSISMWFKPISLASVLAIAIWIGRDAGWKRSACWMVVFVLGGLIPVWALNRRWDGLLLLNMIDSLDNGWDPAHLGGLYFKLRASTALVFMFGIGISVFNGCRGPWNGPRSLLWIAAPASFAVAAVQYLKEAGDVNYYLESYGLASVAAVWGIERLWTGKGAFSPRLRECILWLVITPIYLTDSARLIGTFPRDITKLVQSWDGRQPLIYRARRSDGVILTINPYLVLVSPSQETILDQVQYEILVRRGRLDDAALIERVRRRDFALAIMWAEDLEAPIDKKSDRPALYSSRFVPALMKNYAVTERIGKMAVLRPKPTGEPNSN